ncbi:flagellar hook-length control protein FliK [Labrys wisconsinensis]|uniref:Flagellar hook-length control protein FliK n=1 Tax=Labrys wisconsinensis TaxID=425677 RepID=A0ABU0JAK7_9HYPH|nr:flagellar hook-length control protein FliK [Labrys wisconsinensis]MDQ0471305.1 flagellar hook-length control protein FliK [Labrys wisconsinensis]
MTAPDALSDLSVPQARPRRKPAGPTASSAFADLLGQSTDVAARDRPSAPEAAQDAAAPVARAERSKARHPPAQPGAASETADADDADGSAAGDAPAPAAATPDAAASPGMAAALAVQAAVPVVETAATAGTIVRPGAVTATNAAAALAATLPVAAGETAAAPAGTPAGKAGAKPFDPQQAALGGKADPAKPDAGKADADEADPAGKTPPAADAGKEAKDAAALHAAAKDAAAAPSDQPAATPAPAEAARPATPAPPAPAPSPVLVASLPQVAVTVAARAKDGESRFQIRLDPPELGRIDVHLAIDDSTGAATTTLTVERMDTLDLLQRDSRALERALNSAGFKTDQGSLQFNLRDPGQNPQGFAGRDQGSQRQAQPFVADGGTGETPRPSSPRVAAYASILGRRGGLDISV